MLEEEHRLNSKNSLLSNVDRVCSEYKIPAVSEQELDKGW